MLLVEPDAAARKYLRELLRERGHSVKVYLKVETAWQVYRRKAYTLVVMDWQLPGMGSMELCRRIRSHPPGGTAFIIAVAPKDQPRISSPCLKPVSMTLCLIPSIHICWECAWFWVSGPFKTRQGGSTSRPRRNSNGGLKSTPPARTHRRPHPEGKRGPALYPVASSAAAEHSTIASIYQSIIIREKNNGNKI